MAKAKNFYITFQSKANVLLLLRNPAWHGRFGNYVDGDQKYISKQHAKSTFAGILKDIKEKPEFKGGEVFLWEAFEKSEDCCLAQGYFDAEFFAEDFQAKLKNKKEHIMEVAQIISMGISLVLLVIVGVASR